MTPAKAYWHVKNLALLPWYALTGVDHRITHTPKRILVIGYAAIGDFIFFMPALEDLRATYPDAHITYLANDSVVTRELVRPLVNGVWKHDWEGPGGRTDDMNERIVSWQFDMVLLTQASPAHYFQKGLASIPWRVGHISLPSRRSWKQHIVAGEPARWVLLDRRVIIGKDAENPVTRNLRLRPGADLTPRAPKFEMDERDEQWVKQIGAYPDQTVIGIHLGAPGNQYRKMWSPREFSTMVYRLRTFRAGAKIILIGGEAEHGSAEIFFADYAHLRGGAVKSFVGRGDFKTSMALMKACDLVIGNDTGPLKAAAAIGVPTLTLLGPTSRREVGIPWPGPHFYFSNSAPCRPCVRSGIAIAGQRNYLKCEAECMDLNPADVAARVVTILESL